MYLKFVTGSLFVTLLLVNPLSESIISINAEKCLESSLSLSQNYDLLIITSKRYELRVQPLVYHKEMYGVKTKVMTVESIYNTFEGRDKQEQIKYCIKYAKDQWKIKYVLLLGDAKTIPVRYVWTDDLGRFIGADQFYTDLYYADIYDSEENFASWDTNNNSKFGEWWPKGRDTLDLYPDVYIGRIPCKNIYEVEIVIKKIINYEKTTYGKSWFKKALLIGGDWEGETPGFNDSDFLAEEVADLLEKKGFEPIKLYSSKGNLNSENIKNALEDGVGFAFFTPGDGLRSTWYATVNESLSVVEFSVADIKLLKNSGKLPIIVVGGCLTNDIDPCSGYWLPFEGGDCWGEAFVKKREGGAIAVLGSNAGSFYRNISSFFSLMEKMFFETYVKFDISHLGEVWGETIKSYLDKFPIRWDFGELELDGMNSKNIQIFSLLGDPSLKIGGYSPNSKFISHSAERNGSIERYSIESNLKKCSSYIYINGNDDFAKQAKIRCWQGNGTITNPYIIENYEINASSNHGIQIENTEVHFIIKNCTIFSGRITEFPPGYFNDGIRLFNTSNGIVTNCTIFDNGCGIRIRNSTNVIIERCQITKNDLGVHLFNSTNITINECTISHNDDCLRYEVSHNNILKNSIISHGFWSCVRISYSSKNSIEECTFTSSPYLYRSTGIILYGSENNLITRSTFEMNSCYGIVLSDSFDSRSSFNVIKNCEVSNATSVGIHIYGGSRADLSIGNEIVECDVHNNLEGIRILRSKKNVVKYCNIHGNEYGLRVNTFDVEPLERFEINHINYNNIYGNKIAGILAELSLCDARHNWWGSALGPSKRIIGKIFRGDRIEKITAYVMFFPWLLKPYNEI